MQGATVGVAYMVVGVQLSTLVLWLLFNLTDGKWVMNAEQAGALGGVLGVTIYVLAIFCRFIAGRGPVDSGKEAFAAAIAEALGTNGKGAHGDERSASASMESSTTPTGGNTTTTTLEATVVTPPAKPTTESPGTPPSNAPGGPPATPTPATRPLTQG
jgi:hypothetical protein